jgi:hypothetical protein
LSSLLSKNVKIIIYKSIILPVVLYGCETCYLTLRKEHKPRVFEIRVLRRIFEPRRVEVTGGWRELHTEELKRPFGRPRCRWVANIKMDLGKIG